MDGVMDGIMEQWIRDARDQYVAYLCEETTLTEQEATVWFTREEWNSNTLRKATLVAYYRAQIINEVKYENT